MISICIVNWNQADLLLDCVASIYKNPPNEEVEVVVVDNASSDDSIERLQQGFPQVNVIANTENAGFGAANNQAIRASKGWAVLLLNNDTLVLPGAIDAMADVLHENPGTGIAGCSQYADVALTHRHKTAYRRFPSLRNSFIHQLSLFLKLPSRFPENRYLQSLLMNYSQSDHDHMLEAAHINGACMMCRRSALDTTGLFDTNLFLFLEDTDLCQRVKKAGYRVAYTPSGAIVHYGSQSLLGSSQCFKEHHYISKCYYLNKHYGPFARAIYRAEYAVASRVVPRILNQEYKGL